MADKGDGAAEKFIGWGIILLIIGICFYFFYRIWTPEIHGIVRWIRFGQMWIISLFTPDDYMVTLQSGRQANLKEWMDGSTRIPIERIDFGLVKQLTEIALTPIKWILIPMIMAIGIWTYRKGPGTHYINKFNLETFIKFQANNFPIISPFVEFNPNKLKPRPPGSPVPAELPLFAEALGPEEWIAYNQIPMPDGKLDEEATFEAFAKQLGKRWSGVKDLEPYKQVLLACFCLKAARKRNESDQMLGDLANCWSHDKGLQLSKKPALLPKARRVLKSKDLAHGVLKKCNQHGWETTALLRALSTAREDGGVLAPATFVWLRGHDRNLWYALNNLGRHSNNSEAIGAMAHFRAERRAERPIPKPKVQDAVESLVEYMGSLNARPVPKLDYSMTESKRGIKKLKTA